MEMDFANACPLVRPVLPRIRFLFVGSRLCSTLPSDGPSRFRPCASLVLHLHQVTQGTFTPKLSDMSDTQAGRWPPPSAAAALTGHGVPLRFATKRSTARCGRAAISNRWFSANFGPLLTIYIPPGFRRVGGGRGMSKRGRIFRSLYAIPPFSREWSFPPSENSASRRGTDPSRCGTIRPCGGIMRMFPRLDRKVSSESGHPHHADIDGRRGDSPRLQTRTSRNTAPEKM